MSKPFAELIAKIEETAENATTLIEEMAKNSASIMEESAKYFKLWAIVALSIIAVIIFFVIPGTFVKALKNVQKEALNNV